jgi:periplasmic protein TonB
MLKKWLFIIQCVSVFTINAQLPKSDYAIELLPIGGREQLEQVLETQLTLSPMLLGSYFEPELTVYFDLDSLSKPVNVKLVGSTNNLLRKEIARILGFFKFKRLVNAHNDPFFFTFKLTAEKYSKYVKQKSKYKVKKELLADSSYIVYSKADKAPEYYKNGDEGLAAFVLNSMEYPSLAIRQSVEGTVVIEFVVETNGYITDINVKQQVGAGCTEEALKVIKQTRWQPAILNNKLVRYKTYYPITFSLHNVNKDNIGSSQVPGQ